MAASNVAEQDAGAQSGAGTLPAAESSTLFFMHLSKTGGTSIRQAAREYFSPERVLMVYGRKSTWSTPFASELMYGRRDLSYTRRMAMLSEHIVESRIAFFSSHLCAAHLPCFDPARAFTILREPVERVLSEYYFFQQKGYSQDPLEVFIERPKHRNLQHRKLAAVKLEALGAVGVLENYDAFIAELNGRFGLDFVPLHENRGGLRKRIQASRVSTDMRRRIETLNEADVAIYRRALEIAPRE